MTTGYPPVPTRTAVPADLDAIVATLTSAFFNDPLWGPAFPDVERRAAQASAMWRLLATSSLRYPWTRVTQNAESVAVWIPPGGTELTPTEEHTLESLLAETMEPDQADAIMTLNDQLASARPTAPHFYLTLLGTHDAHRGKGLGMALVRETLTHIDALGAATYLESSNPANNPRYQSLGFTPQTHLTTPTGHQVTTMWRPAP
jgi:GNAT superfamily N-acetyltransferase